MWGGILLLLTVVFAGWSSAEGAPVRVRVPEGPARGFLVLRTLGGAELAHGELRQTDRGSVIDSRLTLHFQDGSVWDERVAFSQRDVFRLERYRLRQQGPSLPTQLVAFDRESGRYSAVTQEKKGETEQAASGPLEMPDDLYNGLALTLLRNAVGPADLTVHTVVFTPTPRLLTTVLHREGEEAVPVAGETMPVIRYLMKLELGGLAGLVAPLIGKAPPELRFWLVAGEMPVFAKFEGAMFLNGPVWRLEQTVPHWPSEQPGPSPRPSRGVSSPGGILGSDGAQTRECGSFGSAGTAAANGAENGAVPHSQ